MQQSWISEIHRYFGDKNFQKLTNETFDLKNVQFFHKLGLMQTIIPPEFGGRGSSVTEISDPYRLVAYYSTSMAGTLVSNWLGMSPVMHFAQPALQKKIFSEYMNEFSLWCYAMTEIKVGSDLKNMQTTYKKVGDKYILNGEKNYISNATCGRHLVVFARNEENNMISAFYVHGESKGIKRGSPTDRLGWRGADHGSLFFHQVEIPQDQLLGTEKQGLSIHHYCLNRSKTLLGAMGVGLSQRARDLALERLDQTIRYQQPLLDQTAIVHLIGQIETKIQAAWSLTLQAAELWNDPILGKKFASMAKYFSGKCTMEVASQCLELFGSLGYMNECELSRIFRDAKSIDIIEGPSLVQELIIAKELIHQYRKSKTEIKMQPMPDLREAS